MGKNRIINYKGNDYELVEALKSRDTLCPGCSFDKKETFCVKIRTEQTPTERAMSKGCTSINHPRYTAVWVRTSYPWYERLWIWLTSPWQN